MQFERDALHRDAFQKLREICESEGFQFHVIDLRWGVNEEAAWDQRTESLCLEEIRRCRQVSPRPSFIALVGQRYGWRPLPVDLSQSDWNALQATAGALRPLLDDWYRYDQNNVPPVYRLRERATDDEREASYWRDEVEIPLRNLFRTCIQETPNGQFSDAMLQSELSLTEKEIQLGAECALQDQWEAFAYFRSFPDVPRDQLDEPWVDRNDAGQLADIDSATKLQRLRERLHKNKMVTSRDYEARLVDASEVKHRSAKIIKPDTLEALNNMVFDDLHEAIIKQMEAFGKVRPLDREIASHKSFAEERIRNYVRREREENVAKYYISGSMDKPLVLYGASGAGKTSLMARIAMTVQKEFPEDVCVSRFIGATGGSASLRFLIDSIRDELSERTSTTVPESVKNDLTASFRAALSLGTRQHKVIVLLDALDQLSPEDNALSANWIPRELPENCRLIVTCMTDSDATHSGAGVFNDLAGRLDNDSIVEISEPNLKDLRSMLIGWLGNYGRTLTAKQLKAVEYSLTLCPRPLFLRVLVELAKSWHSGIEYGELPSSIHGIIEMYLDRAVTDQGHGDQLLNTTLGLLSASRAGLTESEIFGLLNRNEEVLREFNDNSRYPYPDSRDQLPPVVWSRLFFDLDFFLGSSTAAGINVIHFYHRQLAFVAHRRCLEPNSQRLHQSLVDYFEIEQTWYSGNQITPNVRRAFELPYQLRMVGDKSALRRIEELSVDTQHVNAKIDIENQPSDKPHLDTDLLNDYYMLETIPGIAMEPAVEFFSEQLLDPQSQLSRRFRPGDLHSFLAYRGERIFYRRVLETLANLDKDGLSTHGKRLRSRARVDLAGMVRRQNQFDEARRLLSVVDEDDGELSNSDLGTAWYEIGYVHYLKDEYSQAAEAFKNSVRFAKSGDDLVGAEISRFLQRWADFLAEEKPDSLKQFAEGSVNALVTFTQQQDEDPRAFRWVMNSLAHAVDAGYFLGDESRVANHLRDLRANPWVREFAKPDWILRYEARYAMVRSQYNEAVALWREFFKATEINQDTESGAMPFLDFGIALLRSGRSDEARKAFLHGKMLNQSGSANAYWQRRIDEELERLDDEDSSEEGEDNDQT
ncbi:unnamed protein product [Durusdinium trenchii]|uniref:NACHT domain-containing protein n=1 Tax=Durusdinium trenchii TaxID=1381693 RepID=A0ABP0R7P9_9DINO